jgi:hypothetical protein
MADTKISGLASAGTLTGTELVPVVKSGVTSQSTTQDIADLAGGSNLGNSDLTADANRVYTLNGALDTDLLTFKNSAGAIGLVINGASEVYSYGNGSNVQNTAFGYDILTGYTSASLNALFGHKAGKSLTSATKNCLFGWEAGQGSTTGIGNIAMGQSSLYTNSTGGSNVAIGTQALWKNTTSNNTAVGYFAGQSIVGGDGNSFLGWKAGFGITTGRFNTHIGYQGASIGLTTGSYNTLIGTNFGGLSATMANNVIIADGQANQVIRKDANHNQILGIESALATTATDGFTYLPTCAGTPTGTPTAVTGKEPLVIDSTNNKMYIYSGGAWVALN